MSADRDLSEGTVEAAPSREYLANVRAIALRAVTEGVNLKYVETMRQTIYKMADEHEALAARYDYVANALAALRSRGSTDTPDFVRGFVAGETETRLLAIREEGSSDTRLTEALRERITLWRSHGTEAPLASPYAHLTLVGELEGLLAAARADAEQERVLGDCPHGVDLDREFCPQGCRA